MVNPEIMFKKYGCLGFKDWWIDPGAIVDGSIAQAFEGLYYARTVRLHKQSFEAILRLRVKSESVGTKLDQNMREAIVKLRNNPCPKNLESLMSLPGFKDIYSSLIQSEGT